MGINDDTTSINVHHCTVGIGDASNKKIAIAEHPVFINTAESLGKGVALAYRAAAVGDTIYVRNQVGPSASDASISMIAYGIGG
jgi:hypothetical protein